LIERFKVNEVIFAYSDISNQKLLELSARVQSAGAKFILPSFEQTSLNSPIPVISVTGVRTGVGKSQITRSIVRILKKNGLRPVVVRHPMPYADLTEIEVQKFSSFDDLDQSNLSIEEREEIEPHLREGNTIYLGINYQQIMEEVRDYNVLVFDGGNNDYSFFKSDLYITVADPLRSGDELNYYPSQVNLRLADLVIINKCNAATTEEINEIKSSIARINSHAKIIEMNSMIKIDGSIEGKNVLVIEDSPTMTHGDMGYGAGFIAANQFGANCAVTIKPVGSIKRVYQQFTHLPRNILPSSGYSPDMIKDLEATINATEADLVLLGTPCDLSRFMKLNKPVVRTTYESSPTRPLEEIIKNFIFRQAR